MAFINLNKKNVPQLPEGLDAAGGMRWLELLNRYGQTQNEDAQRKRELNNRFLADNPETAYMGFMNELNPAAGQYFTPRYRDIYAEYQGAMGQQAMSGGDPTQPGLSFMSFLQGLDLNRRYGDLTSRQKGFYHPAAG